MFEDFGQYNLDRLNTKEIKSQDVIKKHSLDPNLEDDPIAKANTIFSSGDELQKFSVLLNFPDLFKINPAECFRVLVPKMQQSMLGASPDYHTLASSAVRTLLKDHIITPEMFVTNFLFTILTAMDSKDFIVSSTWSETLYDLIDYLPHKNLQNDVLPVVVGKMDVSVATPTRAINCKILNQLIKYCEQSIQRRELVTLVVSLCQDVSSEIRAAACSPLASLAISGGPDILKSHLMNALVEVTNDDAAIVKQAAFPALVSVLPLMPFEMLKNTGIPLVTKYLKLAFRNNENLTCTISQHYGNMCLALERGISLAEKEEYFNWYQSLISLGCTHCSQNKPGPGIIFDHKVSMDKMVEIRENGANNFVFMTKFTKGDVDRKYTSLLVDCYHCMVTDPSSTIRQKAASIFSEVLSFYGKSGAFLKQELNILLTDTVDDILEAVVPQLAQLVEDFVKLGIYKTVKDMFVLEFISSLMKCENTLSVSHHWRTYVFLLSQMETLCRTFNTEAIAANFLPLLWKRLTGIRNLPNRKAVFRFIIVILRMSKKEQTRLEIINRIINELCMSNSFYSRMLFMRCCPYLNEVFSTKFVKQNFLDNIFLMSDDQVSNIRWGFVTYIPTIKGMLGPEDKAFNQTLTDVIEKLSFDPDSEVRLQLNSIKPQLSLIDKDKMFPDDKKKYDLEMMHFTNKKEVAAGADTNTMQTAPGKTMQVRPSPPDIPGQPRSRQFNTSQHVNRPASNSPSSTSSARSSTSTSRNNSDGGTVTSVTNMMSCETDLNEKEFLIDAGVQLPVSLKTDSNRTYLLSNTLNTTGTLPVRRSIPGSRFGVKRHSTPASTLISFVENKSNSRNNNVNGDNNNNLNKDRNITNIQPNKNNTASASNNKYSNSKETKDCNKFVNSDGNLKNNITYNDKHTNINKNNCNNYKVNNNNKNNFHNNNKCSAHGNDKSNNTNLNKDSRLGSLRDNNVRVCSNSNDKNQTKMVNPEVGKKSAIVRRVNTSHLPRPLSLFNLPSNQMRQQQCGNKNSTTSLASRLPVYRLSDKTVKR